MAGRVAHVMEVVLGEQIEDRRCTAGAGTGTSGVGSPVGAARKSKRAANADAFHA